MTKFKTEQEDFWAGDFGEKYISRNDSDQFFSSNINFFSKVLSKTKGIENCIEFGANIGINIKAIKSLLPSIKFEAVEINKTACETLSNLIGNENVYERSILNFNIDKTFDLCLIKTVLIHINPEQLNNVYDLLHRTSRKYILIAEYFNPSPVEVIYRGHEKKLFKRDFAGEMLDRFDDLELKDYGFSYSRDSNFPQDNINWFLLEKNTYNSK